MIGGNQRVHSQDPGNLSAARSGDGAGPHNAESLAEMKKRRKEYAYCFKCHLKYRIEQDAQLLANRIALLKQEEMKTWKKIEEAKKRTGEI
jgi:hypothetical protein